MMPARESELGGLWIKTSQAGKKFMSGRLRIGGESIEVVVFENEFKHENERAPDYRVYRSQPLEPQRATVNAERGESTRRKGPSSSYADLDDEIPF